MRLRWLVSTARAVAMAGAVAVTTAVTVTLTVALTVVVTLTGETDAAEVREAGREEPGSAPAPAAKSPAAKTSAARAPAARDRANLVANGDFEAGKGVGPDGWERPDELTTTWAASPGRKGRCIRIDTDVLVSQFREREDELAKALEAKREPPPPPRRKPTREPKYDTVAGLDGVHYASGEFAVQVDRHYRLDVDVRVDGTPRASPKVWVKLFARRTSGSGTRDRIVWKKSLNCEGAGPEWKTFSMVFPASTRLPAGVEKGRVELYPYWPPATYWFDEVRLVEIGEAEARAFEAERGRGEGTKE